MRLSALLVVLLAAAAPPPKQADITYSNIAAKSEFGYRSNNHYTGRKYFPQPMCGGVAVLDYNQDGHMDLFFTNGAPFPELQKSDKSYDNCLLRNRGDGTFEDVTAKAALAGRDIGFSFGVAAGDFDSDGYTDLFVAGMGRNTLYRATPNGVFEDVTKGSGLNTKASDVISIGGAWLDYDNDGRLDLVVSDYTPWTPATDQRCRLAGVEGYCSPKMYQGSLQRLYHSLGGGKFEDVTERAGFGKHIGKGMGIAVADFNQDGWMDVFIANDTLRNLLFVNRKDGTFQEAALAWGAAYNDEGASVSGMGTDAKDFDNDGWPDIIYNDLMTQLFGLLHNAGGKRLQYASAIYGIDPLSRDFSGWSPGFIDYDNDGWKDIYSANGDIDDTSTNSQQHDTMWRNRHGKLFEDVSAKLGPGFMEKGFQRGSAFVDLNNDGFLDIVVTSLNRKPRILMNSGNNRNHWLMVDPVGRRSNRDAIGAQMKLTLASGRTLHNHVTTSVGFMSSSDRRVHFGLGAETAIASLEIRWPSGAVQVIAKPPLDRTLKVEEPAS